MNHEQTVEQNLRRIIELLEAQLVQQESLLTATRHRLMSQPVALARGVVSEKHSALEQKTKATPDPASADDERSTSPRLREMLRPEDSEPDVEVLSELRRRPGRWESSNPED